MKILYVAGFLPCPPETGGLQRIFHIGRQLRQLGDLTFVLVGNRCPEASLQATRRELGEVIVMPPRERTPGLAGYWHYKLGKWRRVRPVSLANQRRFDQLLKSHDLVWFHTQEVADAFRPRQYPHGVLDFNDLLQLKLSQESELLPSGWDRWRGRLATGLARRRELAALRQFGRLAVCSETDRRLLGNPPKVGVVANGFTATADVPEHRSLRLGFIGYLDYGPNRDGLEWFAREVWPRVLAKQPKARLRLVGRISPKTALPIGDGIEPLGFVEDPADEMASWSAMVVPIRFGGGTRIKIIEAFSRGCPVVSTPAGAYGLAVESGRELLLADDSQAFAEHCLRLLESAELRKQLAAGGRQLFATRYNWEVIGESIRNLALAAAPGTALPLVVSVIIPTYNRRDMLLEAIASALDQLTAGLEVIVVDNGSSDGTAEAIAALDDPRIRYLYEERPGVSAARNAGMQIARGRFLLFLDDDDLMPPGTLSRLVAALEAHPEAGVAYGCFENIWPDGRRETGFGADRHLAGDLLEHFFRQIPHLIMEGLFRREAMDGLFFDEQLPSIQDSDFYIRLAARTSFCFIPEITLWRRITKNSLSQGDDPRRKLDWGRCLERYYWRLGGWQRLPPWLAADRLGRWWLRLAGEHLEQGERAAALALAWRSLRYRPLATSGWRRLWQAWRLSPALDGRNDWKFPPPLPTEIRPGEPGEGDLPCRR